MPTVWVLNKALV